MTAAVTITGSPPSFALRTPSLSYRFHVDASGDLVHDHFGSPTCSAPHGSGHVAGWMRDQRRREFPDAGRGDLRLPGVHIAHTGGDTVSQFVYASHEVVEGKPPLEGLPATYGDADDVSTLLVFLEDKYSDIKAVLRYSVFNCGAIVRSFTLKNASKDSVTIQRAAIALDMPSMDLDMVYTYGNCIREFQTTRRRVEHGTQGFQSLAGYSSHMHSPFFALVRPDTTEHTGEAWGFNLVYSGSFSAELEKWSRGTTRCILGLNPLHLSWRLSPGEEFTTPEVVLTYSPHGLGGMSRAYHTLYRHHLSRSKHTLQPRPVLLNNWEATYFDMDEDKLLPIAHGAAAAGVKLFVMDDGWFGVKYPRVNDDAGLGDWVVNPKRFKHGLGPFVDKVVDMDVAHSHAKLKFGIWVEPEMINEASELYDAHPDWVLHAGKHERTTGRNQLVLNLGLKQVQDYIIKVIGDVIASAPISYVKWDNNRAMFEMGHPSDAHRYMLGLYRVIDTLTTRFPDILWEGCASGGGRFDAGLLHYWPQHWTSDNTDALDRLYIQFGATLAYPASSMGCHVSAVPNHQSGRTIPIEFRAHVAMMGGGFGFELDLNAITDKEKAKIPGIVALAERVNRFVVRGEMYRLQGPATNWPCVEYIVDDEAVVLVYQIRDRVQRDEMPRIRLQGLDTAAEYEVEVVGEETRRVNGEELVNVGIAFSLRGDYQSKVLFLRK